MFTIETISLDAPSTRTYTAEGYLIADATFARAGIQKYPRRLIAGMKGDPHSLARVWRPEKEVFRKDTLSSLSSIPITDGHPRTPQGRGILVNSSNWSELARGQTGSMVMQDGHLAKGSVKITDASLISKIEQGTHEVSAGYKVDWEITSGFVPDGHADAGQAYDVIQHNIRNNHLAVVPIGRCGEECSIQDGAANVCHVCSSGSEGDTTMGQRTIKRAGKDYTLDDDAATLVEASWATMDEQSGQIAILQQTVQDLENEPEEDEDDDEKKKKESVTGDAVLRAELDTARARLKKLDSKESSIAMDAAIGKRAELLTQARRLHPKVVTDEQSDEQIHRQVIEHKTGETFDAADPDFGKDYLRARFDAIKGGGGESEAWVRRNVTGTTPSGHPNQRIVADSGSGTALDQMKEAANERSRNAWKRTAA